jgi:hypothetical protein
MAPRSGAFTLVRGPSVLHEPLRLEVNDAVAAVAVLEQRIGNMVPEVLTD